MSRIALPLLALVGFVCMIRTDAAPASAKITSLPGYSDPINFNQYSGYMTVDEAAGRNLFYWFVESQGNPATDPLVLWMNGGPGCSSVLGLLTEHGPFSVDPDDCTKLNSNPYSWNTVANVIYLETPSGVGFSYSLDGNYTTGDRQVAADNLVFLEQFYEQYPEFNDNKLFITGESYAGHYVPQLSYLVSQHPTLSSKLKGFAAGNPSFNFAVDGASYWEFMFWHGLLGQEEYAAAVKTCDGSIIKNQNKKPCSTAVDALRQNLIGITPYNIYAPCIGQPSTNGACFTADLAAAALSADATADVNKFQPSLGSQTFVPCINITAPRTYMQQQSVRDALHVNSHSLAWRVCSQVVNYTYYAPTMAPIYLNLSSSLDILVFSGDVDSCVPYPGTETNVDDLGYTIKTAWHKWLYQGQIAGYVKGYDVGGDGSLSFLTIKGAGHMVATYKPRQALAFFTSYIRGTPY